jgi:hypothetical protein
VLYRGSIVAGWPRHELDREQIGLAMGGVAGERPPRVAEGATR